MRYIRGIYNGTTVDLVEPLQVPPGTAVEVAVPEPALPHIMLDQQRDDVIDHAVMADLYRRGMVASPEPPSDMIDVHWQLIPNTDRPISEDILEDRR